MNKNYNSALGFANRMLANGGNAKILENVWLFSGSTSSMYMKSANIF